MHYWPVKSETVPEEWASMCGCLLTTTPNCSDSARSSYSSFSSNNTFSCSSSGKSFSKLWNEQAQARKTNQVKSDASEAPVCMQTTGKVTNKRTHTHLHHVLCKHLLIHLQNYIFDLLIWQSVWAQENSCNTQAHRQNYSRSAPACYMHLRWAERDVWLYTVVCISYI